jgi:hypothetical protein
MLLECIRSYLQSVLINKYLILDPYHPDTLHLRQQRCEWLFFEARSNPEVKKFGNSRVKVMTG